VPSGILQGKICVIGNGLVVDPQVLIDEINYLKNKNIKVSEDNLKISEKAHIIMPWHKQIDIARENFKDSKSLKIGTTGRGIGPAYEDKASRKGIRFIDLLDLDVLKEKILEILDEKNFYLKNYFEYSESNFDEIFEQCKKYLEILKNYICDTSVFLNNEIKLGKKVLFEGAQGTHLDIDHGTYPYVTSSNTVAANACCGSGVGPKCIDKITGIVKAYTTRVGYGPFPTELLNQIGEKLQVKGAEFGATTGRKRRCGWLDLVILNNAIKLNSLTGLAITKLDVLGDLEEINICVAYKYKDKILKDFPTSLKVLSCCEPIYETLPGWNEDISGIKNFNDLPKNVINYVKKIEQITQIPVEIISVGAGREETIVLSNPFL